MFGLFLLIDSIFGVFVGFIIKAAIDRVRLRKTPRGYFKVEPYDEDQTGYYKIHIELLTGQDLLHTNFIILHKYGDDSQEKHVL